MKMNVYADKYAQNTRKGDMKKKTEPLVCVITGVWYLYGGFVISHWDEQKDIGHLSGVSIHTSAASTHNWAINVRIVFQ